MIVINKSRLPASEDEVRAQLAEHQAELEAHRLTIGVPAPWPKFEILREIVAAGGEFEVVDDTPPEPTMRELALRALNEQRTEKERATRIAAEDAMLAKAALAPDAPPEVKDYAATLDGAVLDAARASSEAPR